MQPVEHLQHRWAAAGLGTMPLPNGKVSVFRRSSKGELSYKHSLRINYIPVHDKIELNLGHDPNVALRFDVLSGWRSNI